MRILINAVVFTGFALNAQAEETRCGWYENPTAQLHLLTDADGEWVLLSPDKRVEGFDSMVAEGYNFGDQFVSPGNSGSYGFGCACIEGEFGPAGSGGVIRVTWMKPLPLLKCTSDPALPQR